MPLAERAIAILEAQRAARRNDLVFPGARPGRPIDATTVRDLLKSLGPDDVTLHGFRSSFRSWCSDNHVEFEVAEQCLAHTVGNAVVQAYQRSDMLERRRPVMSAWGAFISGETDNGEVAEFKRGKRR